MFFEGVFFDGGFFDGTTPPPTPAVKTGTGGIDPRRSIYKPTGLIDVKPKSKIQQRVEETAQIHAEVSKNLRDEFVTEFKPIQTMTMAEIDREIGALLKKKMRTDEEEVTLLILMIASE